MFGLESILVLAGTPLKLFTMFFEGVFKSLVNMIIIPTLDYYNDGKSGDENKKAKKEEEEKVDISQSLFPRRHNVNNSLLDSASVTPCSLDISIMDSAMTMSVNDGGQFQCKLNTDEQTSAPSNNKYNMLATSPPSIDVKGLPISPESNTSCTPIKSEDEGLRPISSGSTTNPVGQVTSGGLKSDVPEVDREGLFVCHYCDAKFKIRGYLTRHIKKHAIQKAYHCPFFMGDVPPELRCHSSGGFSRRDTYKTHLRTRHFIYPKGIKPSERNKSSGSCCQCGKSFENTDKWVEQHIESGECKGLPPDYVRNIKSERKSGKLKMIKTSTGHSRFISTAQSVVEPEVLLNKEALEAMAIVAQNTNRSDILSRYGNNKILMISANFKGESKPKRKYSRKKGNGKSLTDKNLSGSKLQSISSSSSSGVATPATLPPLEDSPVATNPHPSETDNTLPPVDSTMLLSMEQNQSLDSIVPLSSSSSHECHLNNTNINYNPNPNVNDTNINYNPNVNNGIDNDCIMFNDPFGVPLDMEQSPIFGPSNYSKNVVKNNEVLGKTSQRISINETLQRQMDAATLGNSQLSEVEQYANFYRHTFGYNV